MLILRLSAMGDILHAMPAVAALRQAHPAWHIGWAVEPQWKPLLATEEATTRSAAMPIVDCVHVVPARRWARALFSPKTWREVRQTRRELRAEQYDVCIDLQGAIRSAIIAKWAHAKRLVGEDTPREWAARYFFTQRVKTTGVHVIEQAIEVVNGAFTENLPVIAPLFPIDEQAVRKAAAIATPFVLLNPGAGWGAKRWPTDRYATVASTLKQAGYKVLVNAGPGEEKLAAEIGKESNKAAEPVASTIAELIALTRRAALVIGGDTGPVHLASALGIPVVGIFGPTDPARNGPFGGRFRVLRHPESRRDHSRHAAPEAGLLTITPDAVIEAATTLLKGEK